MRPNSPVPPEDLNAYLDDEVSAEERAAIEASLGDSAEDRRELDDLRGLVSLLGGLPQYEPPRSFALSAQHVREANAKAGIVRLLPVVKTLSIAAVAAFMVVTAVFVYDQVDSTNDDERSPNNAAFVGGSGTDPTSDASKESTGDSAPDVGGLLDRGDSAASNAVPPEPPGAADANPPAPAEGDIAQAEATPTITEVQPEETPVSVATTSDSDDDDNRWLLTSAGLGVLALVLVGLWIVLVRTGRAQRQSI